MNLHPELYIKSEEVKKSDLNFVPYFEVENLTPMEEYEILAKRLAKVGIEAYPLNIKDDIQVLLDDFKEK